MSFGVTVGLAEPVSQSCISVLTWQMSLAPRGCGYGAACVIFVKGFCCEGVEGKAGNLKQPLLGVCKAILFDATSPGKPFGLLCSLPPFEHSTMERFFACRGISSSANLGCFSALLFAEADLAEAGCAEVPVHLSRCCSWSLSEARIYVEVFLHEGSFSQTNSLVLLAVLEDYVVSPSIKGKASN